LWSLMMGFWQPVTNLRDCVSQNPPGTTFFLCLLTLALSFICLASYSSTHTLPNPDTTKDWNHLLSALSQFQLCVKENANSSELLSSTSSALMEKEQDRKTTTDSSPSSITHRHLKVPLVVTSSSPSSSLKDLSLHTMLNANQLQLEGKESVNLTLERLSGNTTYTCLTISAPANVLPLSLLPPACPASEKDMSPIHVDASKEMPTASQTCYSLHSKNDPTFTVMLTPEEQSVAVRHLLEVSGCLLGVCLMLCLAAGLTHSLTPKSEFNIIR
uniref:Transmembrane protein 248-like n=1 Tax=Acanthochromis polyacanthus TaxID=80966 RepID=A0A3Q1FNR5_9TELE